MKVLYRLSNSGYVAYLVGGAVRDLLLKQQPKDFDISTDAHPNQIRRLFRNCFLIGRRFRLAHVKFGDNVIETSTFRCNPPEIKIDPGSKGGLYQHSDNTFGTPEEDAQRRDFTVNGLFYDIKTFAVIDYVKGLKDIERGILRSIGDPNIRFREDPVRMLRAVRLSARLGFKIERGAMKAIHKHYREILHASVPRLLEEIFKLFAQRSAAPAFLLLWQCRLMSVLLPELDDYINRSGGRKSPLWRHLQTFDVEADEKAGNGLRLAALYLPLFLERRQEAAPDGHSSKPLPSIIHDILNPVSTRFTVPRAAREDAAHLLQAQQILEREPPAKGHNPPRLPRQLHVADAITLARVRAQAEGGNLDAVERWRKILPDQKPVRHKRTPRRRNRPRRDPKGH